jgi:hypothetical protein
MGVSMKATKTNQKQDVIINRKLWNQAKDHPAYRELLEDLEEAEDLLKAKASAKEFVNFNDYLKRRRAKRNASN